LSTYSSSDQDLTLPTEPEELSKVLEKYSNSDVEIDLEGQSIDLPLLRAASILQVRHRIEKSLTPDKTLIQAIEALDELHTTFNLVSERYITWYSQLTGSPRIKLEKIFEKENLPPQMNKLKSFIQSIQDLVSSLSDYLDLESPKVFPLLVDTLGTQLSVRMVASAGDLSKLARMPSSTIQLLGAEKALFRHMSDGSPPPKHGFLYQHPLIKKASPKDRGKNSRKLAARVSIASKLDYFGEKNG
jgi:nucleolar protein 56|tara:strand:- start:5752 stop:6483 length:732 start_codon:yes stop_codon:yes gene_type:complete